MGCCFWSIEIAGDNPSIESTSGLSIWPKIAAHKPINFPRSVVVPLRIMYQKAKELFPEPDRPVTTTNLFSE